MVDIPTKDANLLNKKQKAYQQNDGPIFYSSPVYMSRVFVGLVGNQTAFGGEQPIDKLGLMKMGSTLVWGGILTFALKQWDFGGSHRSEFCWTLLLFVLIQRGKPTILGPLPSLRNSPTGEFPKSPFGFQALEVLLEADFIGCAVCVCVCVCCFFLFFCLFLFFGGGLCRLVARETNRTHAHWCMCFFLGGWFKIES